MEKKIDESLFTDTGYCYTLSLIAGKYKPIILYCLMEYQPVRFNEMRRYIHHVSDKTLSQNLKELVEDELIFRKMYSQIPPKVEYTLTPRGESLVKILDLLCDWAMNIAMMGKQNNTKKACRACLRIMRFRVH